MWHAWCLHFGVLGDIAEHKKGHFEVQAWIFIDFRTFWDPILRAFRVPWTKQCVFCHACFQASFLMIVGSEFGCLGFGNHAFGIRGIAKKHFHISWSSHDFRVHFS